MIKFVNAKINIGLDIVRKRPDGYHDLSTIFYPVGVNAGTPADPMPFCDIMEVTPLQQPDALEFSLLGRPVDCPPEKNLFVKACRSFLEAVERDKRGSAGGMHLMLEKHLPDGAGMGGGSADAAFALVMLNDYLRQKGGKPFSDAELITMAAALGADCPFFIINRCCYATGIGECLTPMQLPLDSKWIVIAKPALSISTKEAFAGVTPREPDFPLINLPSLPMAEWKEVVKNDFEESLFPRHSELADLKRAHYRLGAEFALMSGSGSSVYGIYSDSERASCAFASLKSTLRDVWLLSL